MINWGGFALPSFFGVTKWLPFFSAFFLHMRLYPVSMPAFIHMTNFRSLRFRFVTLVLIGSLVSAPVISHAWVIYAAKAARTALIKMAPKGVFKVVGPKQMDLYLKPQGATPFRLSLMGSVGGHLGLAALIGALGFNDQQITSTLCTEWRYGGISFGGDDAAAKAAVEAEMALGQYDLDYWVRGASTITDDGLGNWIGHFHYRWSTSSKTQKTVQCVSGSATTTKDAIEVMIEDYNNAPNKQAWTDNVSSKIRQYYSDPAASDPTVDGVTGDGISVSGMEFSDTASYTDANGVVHTLEVSPDGTIIEDGVALTPSVSVIDQNGTAHDYQIDSQGNLTDNGQFVGDFASYTDSSGVTHTVTLNGAGCLTENGVELYCPSGSGSATPTQSTLPTDPYQTVAQQTASPDVVNAVTSSGTDITNAIISNSDKVVAAQDATTQAVNDLNAKLDTTGFVDPETRPMTMAGLQAYAADVVAASNLNQWAEAYRVTGPSGLPFWTLNLGRMGSYTLDFATYKTVFDTLGVLVLIVGMGASIGIVFRTK